MATPDTAHLSVRHKVRIVFEEYQNGDGGHWSASCSHLDCLWTWECVWEPYGDGTELAALTIAAADHERNPASAT